MLRFNKFNLQFGRKKYKILYKTTKYFKKRICGKEIIFDDRCVNFYDNKKDNEMFLSDHLKYNEVENGYILNNSLFLNNYDDDEDDDDEDDDEEDNPEDNQEPIIDDSIYEDDEEETDSVS